MIIMNKIITGATIFLGLVLTASLAIGDDDDKHETNEREGGLLSQFFSRSSDVAPVKDTTYKEECSSCHFAYQPGLLPARSWKNIMGNLENHFDENAELDKDIQDKLTKYLVENAADKVDNYRSKRIMSSIPAKSTPLRVTDTRYFIRQHHEISKRRVKDNPKVGSFSNCTACHVNAAKTGSFDEDEVRIPR